ncbi:MAG: hypothetical protein LUD16_03615, partial [Lachnospiraceae bacterium]|nr:hypothetical protein [Lachnospiraceae bacterium]
CQWKAAAVSSAFCTGVRHIPLDIFREILHNRGIKSELDAWLTFLCEDSPEMIELLLRQYPSFQELYNEIYRLCENMEEIMGYFSEALREMDKNTVQYMIEEQQAQIEEQKGQIEEQQSQLKEKDTQIEEQQSQLKEKDSRIEEQRSQLEEMLDEKQKNEAWIAELERKLAALERAK